MKDYKDIDEDRISFLIDYIKAITNLMMNYNVCSCIDAHIVINTGVLLDEICNELISNFFNEGEY